VSVFGFVTRFKAANIAAKRCYEAAGFEPLESVVSKSIGNRERSDAER